MVSLEKIEEDILETERRDTSLATCERLAILYIVRDHLRGYSVDSQKPLELEGKSELLRAANGKNPDAAWAVIDKHMEAVKVLYPSEYKAVIDGIRSLDNAHNSQN